MAKTVMITGTSTGIGRACTERMAAAGWTVFAGVRKESDGESLRAFPGDIRPVMVDVVDAGQIDAMVARLTEEVGSHGLDGIVNNAGVANGGPIEALSDQDWRWHFDVNVFGVINVTRSCLPLLRTARGRVVNVASVGGRVASPMMGPYSAGKHAVEAVSEALRFELAGSGMQVACIEPGSIKTPIWDKAYEELTAVADTFDADTLKLYDRHIDMMYGFVSQGAKSGIEPAKVADAVFHALTSDRPKHRYLVGPDAKMVGIVSRLPDRLRYRALAFNSLRMARLGKKVRAASPR
jgi:NAD(P)-dependent dehydrogenase (short-subunit alcohol dehydrogenase family)